MSLQNTQKERSMREKSGHFRVQDLQKQHIEYSKTNNKCHNVLDHLVQTNEDVFMNRVL